MNDMRRAMASCVPYFGASNPHEFAPIASYSIGDDDLEATQRTWDALAEESGLVVVDVPSPVRTRGVADAGGLAKSMNTFRAHLIRSHCTDVATFTSKRGSVVIRGFGTDAASRQIMAVIREVVTSSKAPLDNLLIVSRASECPFDADTVRYAMNHTSRALYLRDSRPERSASMDLFERVVESIAERKCDYASEDKEIDLSTLTELHLESASASNALIQWALTGCGVRLPESTISSFSLTLYNKYVLPSQKAVARYYHEGGLFLLDRLSSKCAKHGVINLHIGAATDAMVELAAQWIAMAFSKAPPGTMIRVAPVSSVHAARVQAAFNVAKQSRGVPAHIRAIYYTAPWKLVLEYLANSVAFIK